MVQCLGHRLTAKGCCRAVASQAPCLVVKEMKKLLPFDQVLLAKELQGVSCLEKRRQLIGWVKVRFDALDLDR